MTSSRTVLPYGRHSIDEADIAAVVATLSGDWLTTGPMVAEFEAAVSAAAGGAAAVSVTSGTAALHVAYAAAGISPGDEIITTPLTFVATAATAAVLGAKIVFADVDYATGNLSLDAAAAAVTSRTKAITAVDYAGLPVDASAFNALAHGVGAVFIEDAAHSLGSTLHGVPVGATADITTFSFFPTKNLTTAEGGAVVTPRSDLEERARKYKNHGLERDRSKMRYPNEGAWHQEVTDFGLNYRLPDVLAALGVSQFRKLNAFKLRRAALHKAYNEAFADLTEAQLPATISGADPAWHLYPLRVPAGRRKDVFTELRGLGIGVQVNYMPAYWHPVFEDLGYKRGMCPNAEAYYAQEISLPLFPGMSDGDVGRVVDAVRQVLR